MAATLLAALSLPAATAQGGDHVGRAEAVGYADDPPASYDLGGEERGESSMTEPKPISSKMLLRTVRTCVENGERILSDASDLEFREPPSSRFYLIMIAQEEFAKAFMISLVREGIVSLTQPVRRAIYDHSCKQLVGMILDYMIMHWETMEELEAAIKKDFELGARFPADVASAMNILRHEKIRRWESNNWFWAEDPEYDHAALQVAEGKKDRRKQNALYVGIGRDGSVSSTPCAITAEETRAELERADRYRYFMNSLIEGTVKSHRYHKAMSALKMLFLERASDE